MSEEGAMRVLISAAAMLVFAGCAGASAGVMPSASVTTAIQGWEHYFRLDYAAQDARDGRALEGYVYNRYGSPMVNVQVLGQALDAAGNVVGQRIAPVHGVVPALDRSYFRVAGLPPASAYRASIWAFDTLQSAGGERD
jgi:hypothetical protein